MLGSTNRIVAPPAADRRAPLATDQTIYSRSVPVTSKTVLSSGEANRATAAAAAAVRAATEEFIDINELSRKPPPKVTLLRR